MTFPEIATLAIIAVAYLMGMLVRARRRRALLQRTVAPYRAQMRAERLHDAVDPARGGVPPAHPDVDQDVAG
jgi:hypothetical protein